MRLLRHTIYILALLSTLLVTACRRDDEPLPEPPLPGPPVSRVILVYMIADNNLGSSSYDADDLDEILAAARAGGLGGNRVIVYHDSYRSDVTLKEVTADGWRALKTYGDETSSVDPERMREVFNDMRRLAPADDYGLVLWSHADGWKTRASAPSKAFGDDRGRSINVTELGETLRGQGFSFICFDCCFMANIETLYELRGAARWVTASCIELPAEGMRYDINIPLLLQPEPDIIGSAQATFDYYNQQVGSQRTCAMSVIDIDALTDLAQATRHIYLLGTNPPSTYDPQRYEVRGTRTLFDFGDYVESHPDIPPTLLYNWRQAMARAVVYKASTPYIWSSTPITRHSGLSTYIVPTPSVADDNGYTRLSWWRDVVQAKFINNDQPQ